MKIAIIGGGPGGYVAAIKAAQLGAKVVLVEKEYIGGTCLNTGCIPTKVLLHSTEIYSQLKRESEALGLKIKELELDWEGLQDRKNLAVEQLVEGVRNLLSANKVEVIEGEAKFTSKNNIQVKTKEGNLRNIKFDCGIVATGSNPLIIPIPGKDLEGVITSREAMSLEKAPQSICIIGGGVIGVEFANIYSNLGVEVTIIEMLPDIIANMDREIVSSLEETLIENGVKIYKSTSVEEISKMKEGLKVKAKVQDGTFIEVESEKVLMATGRKPAGDGLGLEEIGVEVKKGAIQVDNLFQTDLPNIYAIGDCTGGIQLAHVASSSGIMVAQLIMGKGKAVDFKTIPYCVYTKPELAGVGLTEEEAIRKGLKVKIGRFPMYANGKSVIMGEVVGLIKIIAGEDTGQVLGVHISGNGATELILSAGIAIRLESTVDELLTTVYAHPTIGEGIHEAAEAVFGKAIHLPEEE